jgi:hypothetical protein
MTIYEREISDMQQALPNLTASSSICQALCEDTPPVSNITIYEREYDGRENEMVPHVVPIGNITVAERGVANIGMEDGAGASLKVNNLDNNNQVDTVAGIGTEVMITPVETPGRAGSLQQS